MRRTPYQGPRPLPRHAPIRIRPPRVEVEPDPEPTPAPEPMIDPWDPRYIRFADLVFLPVPHVPTKGT